MRKPGFGGLLCGVIEAIGTLTGTCWGGPGQPWQALGLAMSCVYRLEVNICHLPWPLSTLLFLKQSLPEILYDLEVWPSLKKESCTCSPGFHSMCRVGLKSNHWRLYTRKEMKSEKTAS